MAKSKYVKIGIVRKSTDPGKSDKPAFITLGNAQAKDKKYRFHTEVMVTDDDGNVLGYIKDGILAVQDPRDNPNITPDRKEKLPEWLLKEIYLIEKE